MSLKTPIQRTYDFLISESNAVLKEGHENKDANRSYNSGCAMGLWVAAKTIEDHCSFHRIPLKTDVADIQKLEDIEDAKLKNSSTAHATGATTGTICKV